MEPGLVRLVQIQHRRSIDVPPAIPTPSFCAIVIGVLNNCAERIIASFIGIESTRPTETIGIAWTNNCPIDQGVVLAIQIEDAAVRSLATKEFDFEEDIISVGVLIGMLDAKISYLQGIRGIARNVNISRGSSSGKQADENENQRDEIAKSLFHE